MSFFCLAFSFSFLYQFIPPSPPYLLRLSSRPFPLRSLGTSRTDKSKNHQRKLDTTWRSWCTLCTQSAQGLLIVRLSVFAHPYYKMWFRLCDEKMLIARHVARGFGSHALARFKGTVLHEVLLWYVPVRYITVCYVPVPFVPFRYNPMRYIPSSLCPVCFIFEVRVSFHPWKDTLHRKRVRNVPEVIDCMNFWSLFFPDIF